MRPSSSEYTGELASPPRWSANLEWLFAEAAESVGARVRAAAEVGFGAVEIWSWRDKPLDVLADALTDTRVQLESMIVEPQLSITDPASHPAFLDAVERSAHVAQRFDCPNLVVTAGDDTGGSRASQRRAVIAALRAGAERLSGSHTRLLLEPLNRAVPYHAKSFLNSTMEGLSIVREVDSPRVRLLFDVFHSAMSGEDPIEEYRRSPDLIGHIQIADVPERHEPGTGSIDWPVVVRALESAGYDGYLGLEFIPSVPTGQAVCNTAAAIAPAVTKKGARP